MQSCHSPAFEKECPFAQLDVTVETGTPDEMGRLTPPGEPVLILSDFSLPVRPQTMSQPFNVRAACQEDWPVIADFNTRLAEETERKALQPDVIGAGVRALLADPRHGRYFVALDGEVVIGQIMHTREWSDWRNGEIWWLQSVYVRSEYRKQGVFRLLSSHVEQLARNTPGVVGLRLYVETHNSRAQAAYEQMGFQNACYRVMERMFSEGLRAEDQELE